MDFRHNSDVMIHMGMSLLMVALEVSRDEIGKFPSLLNMVKDEMCRYLFQVSCCFHETYFAIC